MKYQEVKDEFKKNEHIASALDISISTVLRWEKKNDIPKLYQLAIQTLTKNKLKAEL